MHQAGFLVLALLLAATVQVFALEENGVGQNGYVPVPTQRPETAVKPANPVQAAKGDDNSPAVPPAAEAGLCLKTLRNFANAVPVVPVTPKDPACVVKDPVSLLSIKRDDGNISLPGNMLNTCSFALEYARWIVDVANPLARQHLGSALASVQSGQGFVCRRRNNKPDGKLSEHAFGNAIDITGFRLANGQVFSILDPTLMERQDARFFAALRKTACGYFSTVLGPGSNAAHATHLHLDLAVHGRTGNYRICE